MSDLPAGPARVRIRQIALCTDDIWPVEQYVVANLGVAAAQRDPENVFEMRNAVFAVGDTFLEVLQPTAPSAPSARFLAKHDGPGGYMLILQVDDLDTARRRVDALGIRIVHDMKPSRQHGVEAAALHLHPADTGGSLISLDAMVPAENWAWAGPAWRGHVHTEIVDGIVGADLSSADPDALAAKFSRLVDRPIGDDRTVALDDSIVRIVQGPAGSRDQLTAVDMHATDRSRVGENHVVAGTTIRLV